MHTGWATGNGWFEKIVAAIFIHRQFYLYRNEDIAILKKNMSILFIYKEYISKMRVVVTNTNFQSF